MLYIVTIPGRAPITLDSCKGSDIAPLARCIAEVPQAVSVNVGGKQFTIAAACKLNLLS